MHKRHNTEILELLLYLLLAVILVYFVPSPFNKLFFLFVLPLVWRTKRDYLWLAFFLIIEDIPGGLFSGGLVSDPYRLPIYSVASGVSFTIREFYLILIFIKVISKQTYKKNLQQNYFNNELSLLGLYLIILLVISIFLGMSAEGYRNFYKLCIGLTLFISVPRIFPQREFLIKFLNILFPFTMIAILFQVYSLTFGQQLIALLKPEVSSTQGALFAIGTSSEWQRPIEMVHVLLLCFTGSLYLIGSNDKSFNSKYLLIINLLSFLSIFMTGTRSWFIALIIVYLYFGLTRINKLSPNIIKKAIIVSLVVFLVSLFPPITKQINNAWDRLSTLENVVEGDITAGGTASRFDIRAPKVLEGFWSSTIIAGAGFSELFYQYQDGHVGYHNMLLNSGLIGMVLFTIILFKGLFLPFDINKSKLISYLAISEIRTSNILLIALMVINTGTQIIGFTPDGSNRFILMALSLAFINQSINSKLKIENVC